MKKLTLDALAVTSFATTAAGPGMRGTVNGREAAAATLSNCPASWNGTCYITCGNTCPCTTDPRCP
ncbi:MAG TPA: pinensin family lanthipeptide [Longimicrobium sp.]